MKKSVLPLVFAASVVWSGSAWAISMEEKVSLQAAMFAHIETSLIDGVIPHVELSSGEVVDLVPTKAHPMILAFNEKYVLCTDFRDPSGAAVNVDFYMTNKDGQFVVFQTEINNRDSLKKLMSDGKVSMLD